MNKEKQRARASLLETNTLFSGLHTFCEKSESTFTQRKKSKYLVRDGRMR